MWSQHGFWNNLDPVPGMSTYSGGAGFYPGYDQDLSSYYKQHYGYDPAAFKAEHNNRGELQAHAFKCM